MVRIEVCVYGSVEFIVYDSLWNHLQSSVDIVSKNATEKELLVLFYLRGLLSRIREYRRSKIDC